MAWDIVADLTTEIGPRLAGSPREAAARDWAVVRLKALGFQNVRVEPFTIAGWVRGAESAELTGPYPQRLHITALGNSAPTPVGGLTVSMRSSSPPVSRPVSRNRMRWPVRGFSIVRMV